MNLGFSTLDSFFGSVIILDDWLNKINILTQNKKRRSIQINLIERLFIFFIYPKFTVLHKNFRTDRLPYRLQYRHQHV